MGADTEIIKKETQELLEKMGFAGEVESVDTHEGVTSRIAIRLRGPTKAPEEEERNSNQDDAYLWSERVSSSSMLIGERGNNLVAFEYILKKILQKKYGEFWKFTVDINEYRIKRLEDLKQDVKAAAKEVRLYKKEVPLRPMSSFERRIVHLLLAEYPDITTESIGEGETRRVVIKPYP